jgi:hypothetical protein
LQSVTPTRKLDYLATLFKSFLNNSFATLGQHKLKKSRLAKNPVDHIVSNKFI